MQGKGYQLEGRRTNAPDRLIRSYARATRESADYTGCAVISERVLDDIRTTNREAFVPAHEAAYAWDDRALPIGQGQTISQPFIVALMTEVIAPQADHRILEIGTGSGYQAAVL